LQPVPRQLSQLIDSTKLKTVPGRNLDLTAVPAPSRSDEGQYGGGPRPARSAKGALRGLDLGIAAGELPFVNPQRPQGVERNIVRKMWEWSTPKAYLHDAVSAYKRDPRVTARRS
jgi:hypothetical protein